MEYQLLTPPFPVFDDLTPIEEVFANRGMKPEIIQHYLHTTREDILDPALIQNIDAGAKMFIKHLAQGSKIFVQVD